VRRLLLVLVLGMSYVLVPQSLAAPSPTQTAQHDPGVNTVSGFSGPNGADPEPGDTPEQAVARQYPANTIETFRFVINPGEENNSFDVTVGWPDPDVDLDIYVYRIRSNQTLVPDPITSAASLADPEIATYASPLSDSPLRPSEFLVVVHNYCSNTTDPGGATGCPGATDPDGPGGSGEDTWEAEVTFTAFEPGNKPPAVSLSGPTSGRTGESLRYTTAASDPDGTINRISYDLNGDGIFETDGSAEATTSFANAGRYSVGVRVLDNDGEPSYASVDVRITGAPAPGAGTSTSKPAPLLTTFKLRGPVFGGRKNRKLTIRYRLRERSTVRLTLYRGKRAIKRYVNGSKRANRTFRILVRPRGLRRGVYTVRIVVRSADGQRRQSARLQSKRI
jgi:PKD domain-containing protein